MQAGHTPFMTAMHCCAHRTNICVEKLDSLPVAKKIETLCSQLYQYFAHSPKRMIEFQRLAAELETKGLKIQKNVKTRWISLLCPLQSILREYKTLVVQFSTEGSSNSTAKANAGLLLDLETFLSLPCILPLLRCMDELIRMSQSRDVMIQDFLGVVKLSQCQLHCYYIDSVTSFHPSPFANFQEIVSGRSATVCHEWMTDLETEIEYLSFCIGDHTYHTQWYDEIAQKMSPVSKDDFDHVVFSVKQQCREAAHKLIALFDTWFPNVDLLNAFGIVHPQYWEKEDEEENFALQHHFCEQKMIAKGGSGEESKAVEPLLSYKTLVEEQSFFKLTMQGNATKVMFEQEFNSDILNPMTRLWRRLGANPMIKMKMAEWFKLAEVVVVTVIGSVEDERTFSSLSFIKSKLRNRLGSHLDCTVRMFTQQFFTLNDFPFQEAITHWFE